MITYSLEAIEAKYLIRTHAVFKVVEFHPETQTVDIIQDMFELLTDDVGETYFVNEFGNRMPYSFRRPDYLKGVPVKQMRFGQFSIECCPAPGDTGYVEYFTDDISDWVKDGGTASPTTAFKFLRSSCVFVPFVPNHTNAKEDYVEDNTKFRIRGANTVIEITDDEDNDVEINITAENPKEESKATINIVAHNVNVTSAIAVVDATDSLTITSPETKINGDVVVGGTIEATGKISSDLDVEADGISLTSHTHPFSYVGAGTGSTIQMDATDEPQG